jgi:hypothetical protein
LPIGVTKVAKEIWKNYKSSYNLYCVSDDYIKNKEEAKNSHTKGIYTQAGKTDFEFLKELADMNGYVFYIEDDIIFFIPAQSAYDTNAFPMLQFGYREGNGIIKSCIIKDYNISSDLGIKVSGTISSDSGVETISEIGIPKLEPNSVFYVATKETEGYKVMDSKKLIEYLKGKKPAITIDLGNVDNKEIIKETANKLATELMYDTKMTVNLSGIEVLSPGILIYLFGLRNFTGTYFIESVEETIDDKNQFTTSLEVRTMQLKKYEKYDSKNFKTILIPEKAGGWTSEIRY